MDLEQLGAGGPNPCGDSVKKWGMGWGQTHWKKGAKKMSTHFLSLINGWIWGEIGVWGRKSMWRQC